MTVLTVLGSTPLDDFLDDSNSATTTGELLQRVGLFGSLFGVMLLAGLIVFLTVVHRGPRREVATLLRLIALAGGFTVVGASLEIAGVASIGALSWTGALTDSTGSAAMMRLLAGLIVVLGFFDDSLPIEDSDSTDTPEDQLGSNDPDPNDPDPNDPDPNDAAEDEPDVHWIPSSASAFGLAGAIVGVLSFGFDGHTVAEGPRVIHAVVNLAHVAAGSVWFGGIVGLVVVGVLRRSTTRSTALMIIRFSSVATVATIVVTLAGSLMTLLIIDGFGDLTGTDWGRLLLVKVAAVGVAASIGAYNHFVVVPRLGNAETGADMEARARGTIAVEAAVLLFVVALAVLLTSASTN